MHDNSIRVLVELSVADAQDRVQLEALERAPTERSTATISVWRSSTKREVATTARCDGKLASRWRYFIFGGVRASVRHRDKFPQVLEVDHGARPPLFKAREERTGRGEGAAVKARQELPLQEAKSVSAGRPGPGGDHPQSRSACARSSGHGVASSSRECLGRCPPPLEC
jgi:hypothetical protein